MTNLQLKNNFVLYTSDNGDIKFEVYLHNESIWLTQKLMGNLFACSTDNISLHLKKIFLENELQENSVAEEYSVTASDGKRYKTEFYNFKRVKLKPFNNVGNFNKIEQGQLNNNKFI